MRKFVLFHQPKTAGSYAAARLPKGYVEGHNKNYHWCMEKNKIHKDVKLVCVIRRPLDFYISAISFWCLDSRWCSDIRKKSLDTLKKEYLVNKEVRITGHPNYWISNGFTERKLENILENLFSDNFLESHKDKLSTRHHTYPNHVFLIMQKLDIGYYTFAFLDQFSRKKVSEIETTEECKDEIVWIKNNFITLRANFMTSDLKELCEKLDVPLKEKKGWSKSNRKKVTSYDISDELIDKIRYKDRYMLEIFDMELF